MRSTEVQEFLKKQFTGSLATISDNSEADIAIVFFVSDKNELYFKSRTTSTHSENIKIQNEVAFSCYSHDSNYSWKYWVQIHGKVERIYDTNLMTKVVFLYSQRFVGSGKKLPSIETLCQEDCWSTFYKLIINEFKIVDEGPDGNNTMGEYQQI